MREINCSVLGNAEKAQASVLEEVFSGGELLDFHDKYERKAKGSKTAPSASKGMASSSRVVDPDLPKGVSEKIRQLALDTFRVLGSSGVCRIDFMMNADTTDVYVNEINTIPGSLAFYLWQSSGVSFPELMDRIIELALDRERERSRRTYSYDTNLLSTYSEPAGAKGTKS